jgi:hypothetical protein
MQHRIPDSLRREAEERTTEMKSYFVIDVESIGIHGEGFAVAGGVYLENGAAQWEFCMSCPSNEAEGENCDREWVKNNVPLIEVTHRSPRAMREAFWLMWEKAKLQGATMAAECLWPVEAGFVARCIYDDIETRKWNGPYPFLEISSVMTAAGMDPMKTYDRTQSEKPAHHPLSDVRQSARLLSIALATVRSQDDKAAKGGR